MQGEGWSNLNDIKKIFPDFVWRSNSKRFLPEIESLNWRTSFVLPESLGRFHATIRSAIRKSDNRKLFLFELTVRGISSDKTLAGIDKWFDTAHKWIVFGFEDLTSNEIQKNIWGRK